MSQSEIFKLKACYRQHDYYKHDTVKDMFKLILCTVEDIFKIITITDVEILQLRACYNCRMLKKTTDLLHLQI